MIKLATLFAAAAITVSGWSAPVNIATQEWVLQQIAKTGTRIIDATVTTNANGTITVYSRATIPDLPKCTGVSFTISNVRRVAKSIIRPAPPTFFDMFVLRAFAEYPGTSTKVVEITISSGAWYETDMAGNQYPHEFDFGIGGLTLQGEVELPDLPNSSHECDLDESCNCKDKGKTESDIEIPGDLEDWDVAKLVGRFGEWDDWIDKNNLPDGVTSETRRGETNYYIKDVDGLNVNLDKLDDTDAWASALAQALGDINSYLGECRESYVKARICDQENPQHDWSKKTCGGSTAYVCMNNSAHTKGSITHQFPGSSFSSSGHTCKCGATTEAHGDLIAGPPQENATGFTIIMRCPKGCGYTEEMVHTHEFKNCGTCTAGDGCTRKCTGCNGQHVKTSATSGGCAKCGCSVCTDCTWHPSDDINDHVGWEPCGEDIEEDNDNVEARGAHCRCQCLTFGHRAETGHNYVGLTEDKYEDYNEEHHYHVLSSCSRCGQFMKKLEGHDFPDDPTTYVFSESCCKWVYRCRSNGCEHDKTETNHEHYWDEAAAIWVNHSEDICRKRIQCKKCKGWKSDDTHGHERDTSKECACKNGCGYTFDHNWGADPCGNQACSHCGKYKDEGDKQHKGWTEKSETEHICACGKTTAGHVFTEWIKTGADPNVIHYARTCETCPRIEGKDESCGHAWGDWNEIGRGGGVITFEATCTECGATRHKVEPEPPYSNCDTDKDQHYPNVGECGCLCGKYGPNGIASADINFHKWGDTTNGDGILICTCQCGQFHAKRDPSSYMINARRACAGVCAYCKSVSASGIGTTDAEDDAHTPCETQDGRCGCLCGKLTADNTKVAKFHIQKPGTCRCFGANGTGGSWHFPEPRSDCRNICQYKIGGQQHIAATQKEEGQIVIAHPRNHTKTDASSCGCKCGTYTGANHAQWEGENFHNTQPYDCGCYCKHGSETQVPNYHKKRVDTDCDCACGSTLISHVPPTPTKCRCQGKCSNPRHFPVAKYGECPGVCHGECRESKDPSYKDKHTPEGSTRCGCQCDEISATEFTTMRFHYPKGSPECWCAGHHYHTHTPKEGCPKLCAFCNEVPNKDRQSTRPANEGDHTFDKCVCKCGDAHRSHLFEKVGEEPKGEHICDTCGNTITEHTDTYKCKRCGETYSEDSETGHSVPCEKEPHSELRYCPIHKINFVGDECPECGDEDGGGSGTGDGEGNSSNQSGDPDNIL